MGLFAGRLGVAAEAAEGLTLAREAGLPNAREQAPRHAGLVRRVRGDEEECRASARDGARARPRQRRRVRERDGRMGARPARAQPSPRRGSEPRTWSGSRTRRPVSGIRTSRCSRRPTASRRRSSPAAGSRAEDASRRLTRFAQAGRAAVGARARRPLPRACWRTIPSRRFAEALGCSRAATARSTVRERCCCSASTAPPRRAGAEPLRAALTAFERARRRRLGARARDGATRRRRDRRARDGEPCSPASRRRSCRWPGSSPTATRTARSPRGCSAPRGRSTRSCAASSRSSACRRGSSSRDLGLGTEPLGPVLRSRLARAGLAELFRDLRTIRGAGLQEALARTVGDPGLVVAYRRAGRRLRRRGR